MVAGTWICAFSALIPTWRGTWGRFGLDRDIGSCSILPDENSKYYGPVLLWARARAECIVVYCGVRA